MNTTPNNLFDLLPSKPKGKLIALRNIIDNLLDSRIRAKKEKASNKDQIIEAIDNDLRSVIVKIHETKRALYIAGRSSC